MAYRPPFHLHKDDNFLWHTVILPPSQDRQIVQSKEICGHSLLLSQGTTSDFLDSVHQLLVTSFGYLPEGDESCPFHFRDMKFVPGLTLPYLHLGCAFLVRTHHEQGLQALKFFFNKRSQRTVPTPTILCLTRRVLELNSRVQRSIFRPNY